MSSDDPQANPPNECVECSPEMPIASWLTFFRENPFDVGAADILCLGQPRMSRLTNLAATILLHFGRSETGQAIQRLRVILPPLLATSELPPDSGAWVNTLGETIMAACGRELSPKELQYLSEFLIIEIMPDVETGSVISALEKSDQFSVQIIAQAAVYKAPAESLSSLPRTGSGLHRPWAAHVHILAKEAVRVAKERETYILIDTGEFGPLTERDKHLLVSVERCGLRTMALKTEIAITERWPYWESLIGAGAVGTLLTDIEEMPALTDVNKIVLKAQLLSLASCRTQAAACISEGIDRLRSSNLGADVALRLSEIAERGGEPRTARHLLTISVEKLIDLEDMKRALVLSSRLPGEDIGDIIDRRIEELFPTSDLRLRRAFESLAAARRHSEFLQLLPDFHDLGVGSHDARLFYEMAARHLSSGTTGEFVQEVKTRAPDRLNEAMLLACVDAYRRENMLETVMFGSQVDIQDTAAFGASILVLRALESMLRNGFDANLPDIVALQLTGMQFLIRYVSNNPENSRIRLRLTTALLTVDAVGMSGIILVASAVLELAQRAVTVTRLKTSGGTPDQYMKIIKDSEHWIAHGEVFSIGRGKIPNEYAPSDVSIIDGLIETVANMIEYAFSQPDDGNTRQYISILLHIGMLWAHRSSHPERALVLLRIAGGGLAMTGESQFARDLAEQGLESVSGADARRKRAAWTTFADVYQRSHNIPEALLGMACALAQDVDSITSEQHWFEISLALRLLRDFELEKPAKKLLPQAEAAYRTHDPEGTFRHRFLHLKASVDWLAVRHQASTDSSWSSLLEELTEACELALEKDDDVAPCCILLGQIIGHATARNIPVSARTTAIFENGAQRLPQVVADRVAALSLYAPSISSLRLLFESAMRARYASDIAFDVAPAVNVARKLLTDAVALGPSSSAFAVEVLTDHSIQFPVESSSRKFYTTSPEELRDTMAALGSEFCMHFLALDFDRRLVRVTWKHGAFLSPCIESEKIFSSERFSEWKKIYPYNYKSLDNFESVLDNAFLRSLAGLGISCGAVNGDVVAIVADTKLQQLPPNLLLFEDQFLGGFAATASVPSVSWLRSAVGFRSFGNGRRLAWVSKEQEEGSHGALQILADRLAPTLSSFGIKFYETAEPPNEVSGSELVIIGAHGKLYAGNRYFQMVADEGGTRLLSRHVAASIGRARVVVLFVCSAGRTDEHPLSHATVGLVGRLLAQGCNAVISSPWPLNVRVPVYWLPAFLDACRTGFPVAQANLIANQYVRQKTGDDPTHWLAMTVFGDPFTKLF